MNSTNPYFLHPTKGTSWAEGFWLGFFAMAAPRPSDDIAEEDYDAFNEGVAAGETASRQGYGIEGKYVSLVESRPSAFTVASRVGGVGLDGRCCR